VRPRRLGGERLHARRALRERANGGYASIGALQRASGLPALGTRFVHHADRVPLEVDYVANARSLGCEAVAAGDAEQLAAALRAARASSRATVVVCRVDPDAATPPSGAFWDLGVPRVSTDPRTERLTAEHLERAAAQRVY